MKTRHRFVPTSCAALEGRLVLSTMAPAVEIKPVHLSPSQIAQCNASEASFGLTPGQSIRDGLSVAELRTTTYSDGSTQTESLLTVPNSANNTTTTYETINLRNNGGTEKIVDTESFSGGSQPFSGNDNTHNLTITLPNGSTETESYTDVITGHKTVINGSIHKADGIETWTSVKIQAGPTTVTNRTITEPNGTVEKQKIVTTQQGDLDSTSFTITHNLENNTVVRSYSATNVIRVQPASG